LDDLAVEGGEDGLDDLMGGGSDGLDLNAMEDGLELPTESAMDMESAAPESGGTGDDLDLDSFSMDSMDMPQEPSFGEAPSEEEEAPFGEEPSFGDEFSMGAAAVETGTAGGEEVSDEDSFTAVEDINLDDAAFDLNSLDEAGEPAAFEPDEFDASGGMNLDSGFEEISLGGAMGAPMDFGLSQQPAPPAMDTGFTAVPDVDLGSHDVMELNLDAIEAAAPALAGTPTPLSQDILMSIPHQVSVEIGNVALNGMDLMELKYGSVVKLDRAVGDPVDLVLEGRRIARGEVVLINGKNLGIRIVELIR
ncbi:MAG: FliM/FliN family flagellar motor switch protein, partial [Deltaproteobacteria bacterium]|nr:FliM/FliN family flagellar motor switch protein [Deltaproteobacteria bacterium]